MYDYQCERGHVTARYRKLEERNQSIPCQTCGKDAGRAYITPPHMGAIPGIPNRINKDWNETGQVLHDPNNPEYQPKYRNPK